MHFVHGPLNYGIGVSVKCLLRVSSSEGRASKDHFFFVFKLKPR